MLLQLAQQGRSAGIHMLLASQRFGAAGMMNQTAIFGNIHLRMAMQMTRSDIEALTEFGRQGRHLILMTCNLPGKIVVNDKSGDDTANRAGKVAYLSSDLRRELLEKLGSTAERQIAAEDLPKTVVFDGKEQPNLIDNPHIGRLLEHSTRPTPEELESFARKPIHMGGLDIIDWFAAEHPRIIWLGQEFNVRGQAAMLIRRRVAENALIVGSNNPSRYGMLAASLISLALNSGPRDLQFIIADRTIPGTPWSDTLSLVYEDLLKPGPYNVKFVKENKDIPDALTELLSELERRRSLAEDQLAKEPSIFALMTELDRVDELRLPPGMSTSPLSEKFKKLYSEGAPLGLHLILSFSGVRPLSNVVDTRQGLYHFRHRATLQMSEDESHTLVRNRKAAQLQIDGPVPICALYMDMETDRATRFKPYSAESGTGLQDQLAEICKRIKGWK